MSNNIAEFQPGRRVRIVQEIERREGNWRTEVEGVIESVKQEKTGSWYAHSKDDKLWLLRIRLRKADGELTTVTVEPRTKVELLGDGARAN